MNYFNEFTNLQPVTKTIKFRLDPVGNTMENVEKNKVLENAKKKEEKRKDLKVYIDKFHKDYIEKKLKDSALENVFNEYTMPRLLEAYNTNDIDEINSIYEKFSKELSDFLMDSDEYKYMEKKEFIKDILPKVFKDDKEALETIEFFKKSATDVRDLNVLRKRLYANENKHGTIVKRTIYGNLPVYLANANKMEDFLKLYSSGNILKKDAKDSLDHLVKILFNADGFSGKEFEASAYFMYCSQSGIDKYNTLIGGYSKENGEKIPGLNEIIQVHNSRVTEAENKLPFFSPLYKQMMSEKSTLSFVDDAIKNDGELYDKVDEAVKETEGILKNLTGLMNSISIYDLEKVYISKYSFGDISNTVFGKYYHIDDAIITDYNNNNPAKSRETKAYINKRKKALNQISCYSIKYLNQILKTDITKFFSEEMTEIINEYAICKENYNKFNRSERPFKQNKYAKITVKALLDSILDINRLCKMFVPSNMPTVKDEMFYSELTEYIEVISKTNKTNNKIRNYATKKEYEKKELDITFNNKDFLSGWSNSNVSCGSILLKDDNYYLALIDPSSKKCLLPEVVKSGEDNYRMVDYNLVTDPIKSLPHTFMSDKFFRENPDIIAKNEEVYKIYNKHKNEGYKYTEEDEKLLIKYYEECLIFQKGDIYNYEFKKPDEYESMFEFFEDVKSQSYKLNFIDVSASYIDELIDNGSIYLFKISSRDFKKNPKNTPTLYALYWKALFDPKNIENTIYKLNGNASVSFREASLDNPFVHKAGVPIKNKTSKTGETRVFEYDIIKNKRFTYDSFFFSVSITVNYKESDYTTFNSLANKYIRENSKDMHIIGITRGIKNLIYYTVIDMDGNVVEHNTMNVIKNKNSKNSNEVDYNEKLEERVKENAGKKEQWDSEYTIKDLKQGYISQVISKISELMLKYNAIIVLEDLNGKFKDKQKAIEKTVYTDLENALLNKLNLYINKKTIDSTEAGSVMKPYQLCARVKTKQDMKFQNGFVFFISPSYTSNLDPSTGFVNLLDLRYKGKEDARTTLNKVHIEKAEDTYKINVDYKDFKYIEAKVKPNGLKTSWTLNTNGYRNNIFRDKSTNMKWKSETIKLTEAFDELFEEYGIDTNNDINYQIINIDKSTLYDKVFELLRLTLMAKNNVGDEYMYASPIEGSAYNEDFGIADNIASYNMARKGKMAIDKILASSEDFVKINDTTEEWFKYNQNNPHKA